MIPTHDGRNRFSHKWASQWDWRIVPHVDRLCTSSYAAALFTQIYPRQRYTIGALGLRTPRVLLVKFGSTTPCLMFILKLLLTYYGVECFVQPFSRPHKRFAHHCIKVEQIFNTTRLSGVLGGQ